MDSTLVVRIRTAAGSILFEFAAMSVESLVPRQANDGRLVVHPTPPRCLTHSITNNNSMQAIAPRTAAMEAETGMTKVMMEVSGSEEDCSISGDELEEVDAVPSIDCFNCRHTVQVPPASCLLPSVICDNCGLPLPLPSLSVPPEPPSDATTASAESADSLHLLLDSCGVCEELLASGPLCFLACGHLIHDRHRLVYRHCTLCKPHLPPYSNADRTHQPTAAEAAHYRRRKEAEKERYGEEKGPCFALFLEPSEVAHMLVYGEEEDDRGEDTEQPSSAASREAALRLRLTDMQHEASEKQAEIERQAATESDKRDSIKRRSAVLAERQESLARRRDRTANKQRTAEERKLNVYAIGRECNRVERETANIANHISQQNESDREAVRAEDTEALGAATGCGDDGGDGEDSEQWTRVRPLQQSGEEGGSQSQVAAMHARYTHLHNSRTRQTERNEKEQAALSKQQTASEAAVEALRRECSEWADQLATLECQLASMQKRQAATQRTTSERAIADNRTATSVKEVTSNSVNTNDKQGEGKSAGGGKRVGSLDSLDSLHSAGSEPLNSLTSFHFSGPLSLSAPRHRSSVPLCVPSSVRRPVVPTSAPVSVPASLSCRRFPSFSALPSVGFDRRLSGADGKGGRVLFSASGVAVPAMSSNTTAAAATKALSALSEKRAAAEANRGALDRHFVHAVKR